MRHITTRDDLDRAIGTVQQRFSGELALAATNLSTGEELRVNAERVYPIASVFKLAVLVELFRRAHEGEIDLRERVTLDQGDIVLGSGILRDLSPGLQPTLHDLAMLMVVVSDNTATNLLIDRVGGVEAVNRTMRERYGLPSIVVHRRIEFGEITTSRDVAEATPADLMRLMASLARDELVDAGASRTMRTILGRQRHLDQFPRYVNVNRYAVESNLDQPIWVGCKTGFMWGLRADAGIVTIRPDVTIDYCLIADGSTDTSFREESEGDVVNGVLGRLLLEYWWPGEWDRARAVFPSPYVDAVLSTLDRG